jgi:hypothetical protein
MPQRGHVAKPVALLCLYNGWEDSSGGDSFVFYFDRQDIYGNQTNDVWVSVFKYSSFFSGFILPLCVVGPGGAGASRERGEPNDKWGCAKAIDRQDGS